MSIREEYFLLNGEDFGTYHFAMRPRSSPAKDMFKRQASWIFCTMRALIKQVKDSGLAPDSAAVQADNVNTVVIVFLLVKV